MTSKLTKRSTTHYLLFFTSCLIIAVAYSLLPAPYSPSPLFAQEPVDYDRINEVAQELNCPTCSGINLADCRTQTCAQWKEQIGDLMNEGMSNEEVLNYFVTQYGTQVLQEPPKSGFTLLVWVLPFILLLAGGAWLFYTMRKWNQAQPAEAAATTAPTPSTATEPASNDDYLSQVEQDLGLD